MQESIGKRIERLRVGLCLERDDLEDKAGLRFGSLAGIESDRIPGNDEFFSLIANALNVSLQYLKTGEEDLPDEVTIFVEARVNSRVHSPQIAQEIKEEFLSRVRYRNESASDEGRRVLERELEEFLARREMEEENRAFGVFGE